MIVPMERVRIAGSRASLNRCIERLQADGSMHIISSGQDPLLGEAGLEVGVFPEKTAENLRRCESLLVKVRRALAFFEKLAPEHRDVLSFEPEKHDWLSGKFHDEMENITDTVSISAERLLRLQDELGEILEFRAIFEEFQPLVELVASLRGVETAGIFFREKEREAEEKIREIEQAFNNATKGANQFFVGKPGGMITPCLLVYPVSLKAAVQEKVFDRFIEKLQTVKVPQALEKESFASTLLQIFTREDEVERELKEVRKALLDYSVRWSSLLRTSEKGLEKVLKTLQVQNYLALSGKTFWITGWMPASETESLEKLLDEEFSGELLMFHQKPLPREFEKVPVLLSNPFWAKPFERLLAVFPAPAYGSIDPTMLMAVFFPLFFGLMLGDLGYALMLFGLAYFIHIRKPGDPLWGDIIVIISACGLASVVFSLVYGEFFGKLWSGLGLPPPFFHRQDRIMAFLSATLLVGGAHILLGNLLGMWTFLSARAFRRALLKICDIGIIVSAFWMAYNAFNGNPLSPGAVILFVALAGKPVIGGGAELLETVRLFSNILSYARLMAIGMASLVFADLADDFYLSSESVVIGVIGAVGVHMLNFVLGVVDPAIQGIRLHYVEFFSQFYQYGSLKYSPMRETKI